MNLLPQNIYKSYKTGQERKVKKLLQSIALCFSVLVLWYFNRTRSLRFYKIVVVLQQNVCLSSFSYIPIKRESMDRQL